MSFKYLRRNCPICAGARKDCRQSEDLIFCMGDNPNPEYHFLKHDVNGFGIYIEKKLREEQNEDKKAAWVAQKKAEREAREAAEKERHSQSLDIQERDKHFRELLKQIPLSDRHKKNLLARGLTESEIRRGMFRTVRNHQLLKQPVNPKLPGVSKDGDRWVNAGGLLVPVWQGLKIAGCQIRLDYATEDKYRWLKSNKNTSHLDNGEIPIAIINPNRGETIGLCESTGIKPFIASRRLNQAFIGASGRNFKSVKKQIYKAIKDRSKDKPLILYPDANCLNDPQTFTQYENLYKLLIEWGYQLSVADWGQFFNKAIGDIDEGILDNSPNNIAYISWEAFASQFKASKAEYNRLKKFTPTEKLNQQYLSAILPKSNEREIIAIKSTMGTGKTETVKRIRDTLKQYGGLILGSRNSLLIQSAERIGAYHLHQDEAYILTSDRYSWIANCVDSLHRWENDNFDDRILILDEWASTIKHLLVGSTIFKRRSLIVNKLVEAVRRAKYIIVLDGNLKNSDFDYLQKLSGIEKYRKILNEYAGNKREIDFCLGSVDSKGEHLNDYKSLTEWIFRNPNPIAIISDSQKQCEAIHRKAIDKGLEDRHIIRIDSKTVTEDFAKEFLKDPVKYIKNNCIKIVILSPSAESGVDINLKDYFTDLYFFRFHIDTETALQMLNRFRDPKIKWHIWSKTYLSLEGEGFSSPFERKVYQEILEFVDRDLKLLNDKEAIAKLKAIIKDNTDKTHLEAIVKINSLLNYDRANLRDTLLQELEKQGHSIKKGWIEKEESNLKEYRQQILKETAEIIHNAEDIDVKEAEEINNSWTANWKDKCKAEKSLLINKILPGIINSPIWKPELIEKIKSDRHILRRLNLRYLYQQPDMAREMQEKKWSRLLEAENHNFFPSDWRSPLLVIQTLKKIGLDKIFGLIQIWDGTEAELTNICNCAGYWKRRWLFGRQGALSKIQFINRRILSLLGYKLARKRRRIDGELITEYRLQDLYESLEIGEETLPLAEELEKAIAARYAEPDADPAAANIDNKKEAEGSPSASQTPSYLAPLDADIKTSPEDDFVQNCPQREIKVGDRVYLDSGGPAYSVVTVGSSGYLQLKDPYCQFLHSSVNVVRDIVSSV
ncbi:MAG: plasmid replication protein, CyRepA1 family [Cyanobacteriota bacterium]|nr:plasmid replication protein, CyRepA1 family [Cyanobacteriota bacterium]